jgi:hypothetical protein
MVYHTLLSEKLKGWQDRYWEHRAILDTWHGPKTHKTKNTPQITKKGQYTSPPPKKKTPKKQKQKQTGNEPRYWRRVSSVIVRSNNENINIKLNARYRKQQIYTKERTFKHMTLAYLMMVIPVTHWVHLVVSNKGN